MKTRRSIPYVITLLYGFYGYPLVTQQLADLMDGAAWEVFASVLSTLLALFVWVLVLPQVERALEQPKPDGSHEQLQGER